MSDGYETVLIERQDDAVARLVMNRPDALDRKSTV